MKFLPVFVTALVGLVAAECPAGYFSQEADGACNFACSDGCGPVASGAACNPVGGACYNSDCADNWSSSKGSNQCDVPKCFANGCSEGGKCIAPNHCVCGESGAQIVSKAQVNEQGEFVGFDCVSLRKDGIVGAGIALIVITVSISICGGIERSLNKKK